MCGIVGVAGKINLPEKRTFRSMLVYDSDRGRDSTGIAVAARKSGNIHTYKSVGDPYCLFRNQPKFCKDEDGIFDGDPSFILGHNRYATVGKVTAANAHPFVAGDIVGCHNGTIPTFYQDKLVDIDKVEVDSEAVIRTIAVLGYEEALTERLYGAWALVWYNKAEKKLYFTRNNDRPLHYCWTKDHETLLWASEPNMLITAAVRSKLSLEKDMHEFEAYRIYSLDLNAVDSAMGMTKTELEQTEAKYKGFTHPVMKITTGPFMTTGTYRGESGKKSSKTTEEPKQFDYRFWKKQLQLQVGKPLEFYFGSVDNHLGLDFIRAFAADPQKGGGGSIRIYIDKTDPRHKEWKASSGLFVGTPKKVGIGNLGIPYLLMDIRTIRRASLVEEANSKLVPFKVSETKSNVDSKDLAQGFNGTMLDEDAFDKITSNGCAWCSTNLYWDDRDKYLWVSPKDCLCDECSQDNGVLMNVRSIL